MTGRLAHDMAVTFAPLIIALLNEAERQVQTLSSPDWRTLAVLVLAQCVSLYARFVATPAVPPQPGRAVGPAPAAKS